MDGFIISSQFAKVKYFPPCRPPLLNFMQRYSIECVGATIDRPPDYVNNPDLQRNALLRTIPGAGARLIGTNLTFLAIVCFQATKHIITPITAALNILARTVSQTIHPTIARCQYNSRNINNHNNLPHL